MAAPKGNKFAAKKGLWENAIKRALARASGTVDAGLDKLADKVVSAAANGDQWALAEVANRLDGKPTEHIHAVHEHHDASDLSDGQLADIAAGRSPGASETQGGAQEPSAVH
jgi:hypothetical protein